MSTTMLEVTSDTAFEQALVECKAGGLIHLGSPVHDNLNGWSGNFGYLYHCPSAERIFLTSSGERSMPLGFLLEKGQEKGDHTIGPYSCRGGKFFFINHPNEDRLIGDFSASLEGWWAGLCGLLVYSLDGLYYFYECEPGEGERKLGRLSQINSLPDRIWAGINLVLELGNNKELYLMKI